MGIPANYRHLVLLVMSIAIAILTSLKADPAFATATWVGMALMILSQVHAIFTEAPQTAAKVADLKEQVNTMAARLGKSGPGAGALLLMLFAGLGLATIVAGSSGCGTLKQDVTQAIDITNATCKVLDTQPEPAWVYFACSVLDAGGALVQQYTVKIPKPNAAEFAASHVVKPTH